MNNGNSSYAIMYIHESTYDMLLEISHFLSKLAHRELSVEYIFKHNDYEIQSEADYSSSDSCSCYVDCSGFVLHQASQLDKHFSDYFAAILDPDNSSPAADAIPYFGSGPSLDYATLLLQSKAVDFVSLEAGGGSGFGWQLYCDNILLMTAGAGGGGGFAIDQPATLISFGGGGGGGLQLIFPDNISDLIVGTENNNSTFSNNLPYQHYSIGGGNGCGICELDSDSHNVCNQLEDDVIASQTINCGFKHDEDIDPHFTADLLATLQNGSLLNKCSKLQVYGGGGGGGGTDLCCYPFQVGYGFAFSFISALNTSQYPPHHTEHDDDITSNITGATGDRRYTYDIMGSILDQAGNTCRRNGMNDWCCVCSHAQKIIITCLDEEAYVSDECQKVKDGVMRVSWIREQDCCCPAASSSTNINRSSVSNTYTTSKWSKEQWKNYTVQPIANLPGYNLIINHGENSDESTWNDVKPFLDRKHLSLTIQEGLLRFEQSLQFCKHVANNDSPEALFQHSALATKSGDMTFLLFGGLFLLISFVTLALGMVLRRRRFILRVASKSRDKSIALQYFPLYGSFDDDKSIVLVRIEDRKLLHQ